MALSRSAGTPSDYPDVLNPDLLDRIPLDADVVLDVAGMAWFERLLLQLGPGASVVRPPELSDLAAGAARRVLHLYREDIE